MGHWARIDENNIVQQVVVITEAMLIIENYYGYDKSLWIKTSYNTSNGKHYVPSEHQNFSEESSDQSKALRFRFAGIGMIYDADNDVFYPPKPEELPDGSPAGDTWILNKTTWSWELPVPYPADGYNYKWDNELYKSDNTKGWVLNMPYKPFASWVWELEKDVSEKPIGGHWAPPIPQPTDQKPHRWDEDLHQSDNTKGWIEVDPETGKDI